MTKPHKHAELIKKWADDPSQTVWFWNDLIRPAKWTACDVKPEWREYRIYAIGEKPTSPPAKMCVLAGVEFPMPMTEAPAVGREYFAADSAEIDHASHPMDWDGDDYDMFLLNAGVVHLSKDAAIAHTRAIIAATKQAMEAAK